MKLKSIFFFILFFCQILYCQEIDSVFINFNQKINHINDTSKKVSLLLLEAEKQSKKNSELSDLFLHEANKYIKQNDYKNKAKYFSLLAAIDRQKGNYAKALEEGLKSYELYEKIKDTVGLVTTLKSLGVTNRFRTKNLESITYYNEALQLSKLQKDSLNLSMLYTLKGVAYHNLNKLDTAEIYYKKSLQIAEAINNKGLVLVIKNNLAIFYLNQDIINDYLPILLEYLAYNKQKDARMPISISYHNTAYYLYKTKDYSTALTYLDSALQLSKKEGFKFRFAKAKELKSKVYEALGNYELALKFSKEFSVLKDSVFNIESEKKLKEYELNRAFDFERKEYELNAEIQQTKFYLYLFVSSILFITAILIVYLLRKNYTNKIKVIDADLEKEKLKKELLDEKVKASETELKWLIADNQMRVSYLQDFYNQLKLDDDINDVKGFKSFLRNLRIKLSQQINTQEKLSSIQNKIKDTNKGFEASLIKKYPELTKSEREVCFLLRINLSIKEMAAIRNSSVDAIKSIRYRLRKKLDLPKDVELESFIKLL